jgi:chromosome segregation protein
MNQPPRTRRLKSLELQGYKSFASKTVFEFGGTITAVVGPNGSGKSNIADAIRWVLGEQAYSTLRGRKTEDMIFSGSEARPRAGLASATITFDNRDGWLPIDYAEVAVSRRAHRDGQNEYLLNNQRVRLRDIEDLLGSVGLAERNYTIIGQGLVDAVLSLRPDERIKLFEEAAGITVHRMRREEALRRLEKTQNNLERVKDILAEIRPRLRSLAQLAERASVYDRVREELAVALRQWYGHHWHRQQSELEASERRAQEAAGRRQASREGGETAIRRLEAINPQADELRGTLEQAVEAQRARTQEREVLERAQAVAEERLRWLEEEEIELNAELLAEERSRIELTERVTAARAEAEGRARQLNGGSDLSDLPPEEVERRIGDLERRLNSLAEQQRLAAIERADLEAREQVEADGGHRPGIAGRLEAAARRGQLTGWLGELNQRLQVEPPYETAIAAALDGFSRGIVFREFHHLEEVLEWLNREQAHEKLALVPQSRQRELPRLETPTDPDCLGRAADLVRAAPEFHGAVEVLLGRTLVVRDLRAARRLLDRLPLDARIVTLAGQVFYPAGQVLISVNGKGSAAQDRLRDRLNALRQRADGLEAEQRLLAEERDRLGSEWKARLSAEVLVSSRGMLAGLESRYQELEVKVARLRERLSRNQTAQSKTRLESYEGRSRLGKLRSELADAASFVAQQETALAELEAGRLQLLAEDARIRESRREVEEEYTQSQIELARLNQLRSDTERRIQEDFGLVNPATESPGNEPIELDPGELIASLIPVAELPPDFETGLNRKRAQLRRLGSVDAAAQQEYSEVKSRHDFLQEQIQDLTEAEAQLTRVIQELDERMAEEFKRTFTSVSEAFSAFFVRLFAGGAARLDYLGEEGIEIHVKLPGRRNQGLAMLSGGERSLTAVALIFALLSLSPTPFCVLDEVDAMLDERNVERFGAILRELSQRIQFLVITHNRLTIQAAEVLYGISQGRDKSSEVISLRLDEVDHRLAA